MFSPMSNVGGHPPMGTMRRAGSWGGALLRHARASQGVTAFALMVVAVVLGIMRSSVSSEIPVLAQIIPVMAGGVLLSFRWLVALTVVAMVVAGYTLATLPTGGPLVGPLIVLGLAAWIVLTGAKVRSRLGVLGTRGETMLIELREVLVLQGELPDLPRDWRAESYIRSAGGASFSGDFVVSATTESMLEVALVDVSGKGVDAGTRALLLSGAFGGLLGVVAPEEFLPAANQYLRRQQWEDDFATVVHVALDLDTGDYQIRTAGHPPAIHFDAWSGRWQARDTEGPLLGLLDDPEFRVDTGQLKLGDALLLYSDGMVETRRRDIGLGIDKLVGHAERWVARGFKGAARQLVEEIGGAHDDSALVVVHRATHPSHTTTGEQIAARSWLPNSLKRRRTPPRAVRTRELTG